MNPQIKLLVKELNLQPHPEGGYYSEVYRSDENVKKEHLPARYKDNRNFSTSIYFLLLKSNFSAFHRLKSDETWHFYEGSKLLLYIIQEDGKLQTVKLGNEVEDGDCFQYTVKRNLWMAAAVENGDYSLVGCTVSPGFVFADFEMADRKELTKEYPKYKDLIDKYTR